MSEDILPDEALSPEDVASRKKSLALAAHIEHLYATDEGFRRWYDEGFAQMARGEMVDITEEIHAFALRAYERLLSRAYTLLEAIAHPHAPVERYDVAQWLEDARKLGIDGKEHTYEH